MNKSKLANGLISHKFGSVNYGVISCYSYRYKLKRKAVSSPLLLVHKPKKSHPISSVRIKSVL